MLNTKVIKLEEDIINLINESEVAPAIVSLILERVQKEANFATRQALKDENEYQIKQQEMLKQQMEQTQAQPEVAQIVQETEDKE